MAANPTPSPAPQGASNDAVTKAVEAARTADAARIAELEAQVAAQATTQAKPSEGGSTKGYTLLADSYSPGPGEGTFVKGDKVQLTKGRAEEMIAAGAVEDPSAKDAGGKPGGETKAPE